jgi:hypothetical protein
MPLRELLAGQSKLYGILSQTINTLPQLPTPNE